MLNKLTSTYTLMLLSVIIMTFIFILKINSLPPQIPLFYSHLEGDNQIADLLMIFLLPLFSFIFVMLNNFISNKFFSENYFVKKITYYTNMIIIILVSIFFFRIIFLIT